MDLVIDSGIAIKWCVIEEHSPKARRIFDGYIDGSLVFCVPDLFYSEIGNIVWKKQRFDGLAPDDAQSILHQIRGIELDVTRATDLLNSAYNIAITFGRSFYDSLYLALAQQKGCRFVTGDIRLANAVGHAFPNIVRLADWPA